MCCGTCVMMHVWMDKKIRQVCSGNVVFPSMLFVSIIVEQGSRINFLFSINMSYTTESILPILGHHWHHGCKLMLGVFCCQTVRAMSLTIIWKLYNFKFYPAIGHSAIIAHVWLYFKKKQLVIVPPVHMLGFTSKRSRLGSDCAHWLTLFWPDAIPGMNTYAPWWYKFRYQWTWAILFPVFAIDNTTPRFVATWGGIGATSANGSARHCAHTCKVQEGK